MNVQNQCEVLFFLNADSNSWYSALPAHLDVTLNHTPQMLV